MQTFRDVGWLFLALGIALVAMAGYVYLQWTHGAWSTESAGLSTACCLFAAACFFLGGAGFLKRPRRRGY